MSRARVPLIAVLACALLATSATGCRKKKGQRTLADAILSPVDTTCTQGGTNDSDPARILAGLLRERSDYATLAPLFAKRPANLDAALIALFPDAGAAGKTIGDHPAAQPAAPYTGVIDAAFKPVPIAFPIDWQANPLNDTSWQLWFQSLNWIGRAPDNVAAVAVVQYAASALYLPAPLKYGWNDHAVAMRMRVVTTFATRYIAANAQLDRAVLHAAAQIIVSNIYALASSGCYATRHNHGLMQDLALLEYVRRFPALRDTEKLWQLGLDRARAQLVASVKPDGIHIENSPSYQLHEASLGLRAVAAARANGGPGDKVIEQTTAAMLSAVVQMMQPNLTLPQFGDTPDLDRTEEITGLIERARTAGIDPKPLDELDWILSRGARGKMPTEVDKVFPDGGFAAFRDAWAPGLDGVTAHFRVGHFSRTHFHPDETGIELYGYGSELIEGPGVHGYDPGDVFWKYQRSPAAHNVLVVDEMAEVPLKPHASSVIVAHGENGEAGEGVVWVQGTHPSYKELGITMVRSFAYRKPETFAVIDHVASMLGSHRYDQHFHLHPRLDDVRVQGATVVARPKVGTGPTVTLTAAAGATVKLARGVKEGETIAGWHFPDKYKEEPATDVVFHRASDATKLELPVLILIAAPGAPALIPTDLRYAEANRQGVLSWKLGGQRRSVSVPVGR